MSHIRGVLTLGVGVPLYIVPKCPLLEVPLAAVELHKVYTLYRQKNMELAATALVAAALEYKEEEEEEEEGEESGSDSEYEGKNQSVLQFVYQVVEVIIADNKSVPDVLTL